MAGVQVIELPVLAEGVLDLDAEHPLPDAPWFPPDGRRSVRRVWIHVIADYGSTVESEIEVFGLIARADDDPAGHRESCGDAVNEGVLAEVGDGAISHGSLGSHLNGAEVAPLCRVGRSNEPA